MKKKKGEGPVIPIEKVMGKLSQLSRTQRILISIGIFVLVIGSFVSMSFLPKFQKFSELNAELSDLKGKLQTARSQASQINKFRKDAREADQAYRRAMQLLPDKKEIPDLLSSISASGKEANLEFVLFQPKEEQQPEGQMVSEMPVAMHLVGSYHDIAMFFDKVSKLPRIVNIKQLSIAPEKGRGAAPGANTNWDQLMATCEVVTFRFLEPMETSSNESETQPKG